MACKAPVFSPNIVLVCLVLLITLSFVIAGLLVLLVLLGWIPGIRESILCKIKQITFMIQHCGKGNKDPNIEL